MEKERQMFALVEAWEKSGEPQPDFCAQHRITLSSLATGVASGWLYSLLPQPNHLPFLRLKAHQAPKRNRM